MLKGYSNGDLECYKLRPKPQAIFFDCDDCLYFDGWQLASELTAKIEEWCVTKKNLPPGEARRDLPAAKNRISKKFHTRGAFPENYRFPVILGLVDAADCSHCMQSFQSPIGTHSQRGDN